MPRVDELHKQGRCRELIAATWVCVAGSRFGHVPIDAIVAQAGVSTGMVYTYFDNKEDLVDEALKELVSELTCATGAVHLMPVNGSAELFGVLVQAIEDRMEALEDTFGVPAGVIRGMLIVLPATATAPVWEMVAEVAEYHSSTWHNETGADLAVGDTRMIGTLTSCYFTTPVMTVKARDRLIQGYQNILNTYAPTSAITAA